MGSAIAYNLIKRDPNLDITVIEKDSTYTNSSTLRSDGNTRIQFNLPENIKISLYGLEALETFEEEMATDDYRPTLNFRQQGNIFVVNPEGVDHALAGLETQKSLGALSQWVDPAEINTLHPLFEYRPSDHHETVAGATFGIKDGAMSPLDVLMGYRRKAVSLGVNIVEAEVVELCVTDGAITGVQLTDASVLTAPVVVNAAGGWAGKIASTIGVHFPIKPIKREAYAVETDHHFDEILPMIVLPSGNYAFHEGGGHFVVGGNQPHDPETTTDFSYSLERFEENLWPKLVEYMPSMDRLKVTAGWAGLYAYNTFDYNALLGEWPETNGFYQAHGFSGHGFQQCHAVGRYLSELILGVEPVLDLSIFSPQRILENKPVFENPNRIV